VKRTDTAEDRTVPGTIMARPGVDGQAGTERVLRHFQRSQAQRSRHDDWVDLDPLSLALCEGVRAWRPFANLAEGEQLFLE
jgi:hypothetical protein